MRIAINTRTLLPDKIEGIGNYTDQLLKRWSQKYPEHEFHLFFDRSFHDKYIYSSNVIAHVIHPPTRHPWLWQYWFEYAIVKKVKDIKAEVFFSPDGFCSTRMPIPTLFTLHDLAYINHPEWMKSHELSYYQKWVPKFIKKAEYIATVSLFSKSEVENHFPEYSKKCHTIFNGIDKNFSPNKPSQNQYCKTKITKGQDYFLYIGSIHPRKNVGQVIKAFDLFKTMTQLPHKLVLAGRMSWGNSALLKILNSSTFSSDIIHIESFEEDRFILIGAATAILYTSHYEGFGLPILEAMRAGTPVITSDVGAMKETAGDAAILVSPYSTEEIKDAMTLLIRNTSMRQKVISAGIERSKLYSWDSCADKTWALLQKCLE